MSRIDLYTPFLEGGIQNINFFNGRILTGRDMQEEQAANRRQHQQVGQAAGAGVVRGLEVSLVSAGAGDALPRLNIEAGLAFNRAGQALSLATAVEVNLVRPRQEVSAGEAGLFASCLPPDPTSVYTGAGLYILAVTPASGFQERAPMHGLNGNGRAGQCGFRYAVEGVQFKLIYIDVEDEALIAPEPAGQVQALLGRSDAPGRSRLRNLTAHLCLGSVDATTFARTPFPQPGAAPPAYSLLDKLRAADRLSDCDIPLALIFWTTGGVQFVDLWAVRRRLVAPPAAGPWAWPVSDHRLAVAEAAFFQFQHHLARLLDETLSPGQIAAMNAVDYFSYLPPAGLLPLATGLEVDTFFREQPHRPPEFIDRSQLYALLRQAAAYEPIALEEGEMVWLYKVWQTERAREGGEEAQAYLVFTSPDLPYAATARYDAARWDYANYAK